MEGTYISQLPKDVRNILDSYQKEHLKKLIRELMNNSKKLQSQLWEREFDMDLKHITYYVGILAILRENGIETEVKREDGRLVINIKDLKLISHRELFEMLVNIELNHYLTVGEINKILRQNNEPFRLISYDWLEMEYVK